MKKFFVFIFTCAFGFYLPVMGQQQEEQLAEVLVLPFANETGKKEYEWLSKNLPNAIIDSMKEKFRFNLMTRDRFEEIVVLSKTKEPVFFRPHTDEKEIVKISNVVNADIIIYGQYAYDKANKTIAVNAFIYHRSRQKTTGNIEMDTPVTSEMFKLVDKVADSVIEHIAVIAKEDAEAAKKAGEAIAIAKEEIKAKAIQDDKISLIKREAPIGKSYRIFAGASFTGGMEYFADTLRPGFVLCGGITNSEREFWHYGASFAAIYLKGNENRNESLHTDINIIEYMCFLPLTLNGGISIATDFYTTFQLFAGFGVSIDMMKIGKDPILLEGEPYRDENTMQWYLNPVATLGLRLPIALGDFLVAPFVQMYGYTGKTNDGQHAGFLLLLGAQFFL